MNGTAHGPSLMTVQTDNKMKLILLSACCFLLATGLHAQEIAVKNMKGQYSLKDKIPFTIINGADSCLDYTVAIEVLDNDGWRELASDIFNYTATKKTRIFSISSSDTTNHTFLPAKKLGNFAKGRQFRLKIPFWYCQRDYSGNVIHSMPFRFSN